MPIGRKGQGGPAPDVTGPAPRATGIRRKGQAAMEPLDPQVTDLDEGVQEDDSSLADTGKALVGGTVAAGGAAWLLSKLKNAPGVLGKIGKGAEYANAARQQLMLSGLALPKSVMGNAGAAVTASLERGSMAPIKEMFSLQTVKDAAAAYKRNAGALGAGTNSPRGVTIPGIPTPGRMMGAADEAAQMALKRGGLSDADAAREVLQAPLPPQLAEALDSPVAQFVHPFRRTPFNQFLEGLRTMKPENMRKNKAATAAYLGTGAVHGAATADDDSPVSIPVAMAGSGRYAYPYGAAAIIARALAEGKVSGSGIASGMLPVSEYGVEQSLTDPLQPFKKPAALTALERLSR
jgi:hypothetical protein